MSQVYEAMRGKLDDNSVYDGQQLVKMLKAVLTGVTATQLEALENRDKD